MQREPAGSGSPGSVQQPYASITRSTTRSITFNYAFNYAFNYNTNYTANYNGNAGLNNPALYASNLSLLLHSASVDLNGKPQNNGLRQAIDGAISSQSGG
jgi:hypothetical protein